MNYDVTKKQIIHFVEVIEMANIKSAKKRIEVAKVRTERNKAIKSKVKTAVKKVDAAIAANDKDAAADALVAATKEIDKAFVAPAREVLTDSTEALIKMLKDAHAKQRGKHGVLVKQNIEKDLERIEAGLSVSAPDRYIPLVYKFPATLFDYLSEGVVVSSEFIKQKEVLKNLQSQQNEDLSMLFEEGILFAGCEKFSLDLTEYISILDEGTTVLTDSFIRSMNDLHVRTLADFGAVSLSHWGGDLETLLEDLRDYADRKFSVAVLCGTERAAHALTTDLLNHNINAAFSKEARISPGTVFVLEGSLSTGFELPLGKVAVISKGRSNVSEKKKKK